MSLLMVLFFWFILIKEAIFKNPSQLDQLN